MAQNLIENNDRFYLGKLRGRRENNKELNCILKQEEEEKKTRTEVFFVVSTTRISSFKILNNLFSKKNFRAFFPLHRTNKRFHFDW